MRIFRFVPAPTLPLTRAPLFTVFTGKGKSGGCLRGIRPYALLCLLCLILYAPGLAAIPPLDRDEARFAQATRQMLETGDFIRIRFQDEARNKKPIGIYWLQAAAVGAFSSPESAAIWPYRVPSALGGHCRGAADLRLRRTAISLAAGRVYGRRVDRKRVGGGGRGAPRQNRCGAPRRRCRGAGRAWPCLHCGPLRSAESAGRSRLSFGSPKLRRSC